MPLSLFKLPFSFRIEDVLYPLAIFIHFAFESLWHPTELARVLLGVFYPRLWNEHWRFQVNNYYDNLTRAGMQSDLRWALVNGSFYYPKDGILRELGHAKSRWRRWLWLDRGPLYALFDKYAVDVVDVKTGRQRKVRVWTRGSFTAFVADRLGNDNAAAILWRCFCYIALYPFTQGLVSGLDSNWTSAEHGQLGLADWVQAVAMLATDTAEQVEIGHARYTVTGPEIWYQFFSFAVRSNGTGDRDVGIDDFSTANDADDDNQSVWRQVGYVASARLPLEYCVRGPLMSEILPRVRPVVTEAECVPVRRRNFAIPYEDMVYLFAAILRVQKRDLHAILYGLHGARNRGLGLASYDEDLDGDWDLDVTVAKNILAVANVHGDLSYKQYEALWHRYYIDTPDSLERFYFHHELEMLWRSLFSVFPVDGDLTDMNRDGNTGEDQTPKQPAPPLVLQALDFLHPIFVDKWHNLRMERRKNTLVYSSETSRLSLSRDAIIQALTGDYVSKLIVIYGRTMDSNSKHALVTVSMASPLWRQYLTGAIDDHYVDEKHVLMELAPQARVLQFKQFSPAKAPVPKSKRLTLLDLVDIDETADSISFGHRLNSASGQPSSGLRLDLAAGVATLTSAPQLPGHYVEIPAGSGTKTPGPVASPTAWTTSMTITKLQVYEAYSLEVSDLAVPRGLRRSSRLQAAEN